MISLSKNELAEERKILPLLLASCRILIMRLFTMSDMIIIDT